MTHIFSRNQILTIMIHIDSDDNEIYFCEIVYEFIINKYDVNLRYKRFLSHLNRLINLYRRKEMKVFFE